MGRLFSFSGRASRSEWWLYQIALFLLGGVVGAVLGVIAVVTFGLGLILVVPVLIPFYWVNFALAARRWHDRGKSGWWTLIIFVPLIGGIWFLIEQGFLGGTDGENRYG